MSDRGFPNSSPREFSCLNDVYAFLQKPLYDAVNAMGVVGALRLNEDYSFPTALRAQK